MKGPLKFFLLGVILVTFFLLPSKISAEEIKPAIYMNDLAFEEGGNRYAYIYVSDAVDICSLEIVITVDDALTISSVSSGWIISNALVDINISENSIFLSLVSSSGINGSGEMLRFIISSGSASVGYYDINIFVGEAYNSNLMPLEILSGSSQVHIKEKTTSIFEGQLIGNINLNEVIPGDPFIYSITSYQLSGLTTGVIKIYYDKSILEVNYINVSNVFKNSDVIYSLNNDQLGIIQFSFVSLNGYYQITELLVVEFQQINQSVSQASITCKIDNGYDENFNVIKFNESTETVFFLETDEEIYYPKMYLSNHIGFSDEDFTIEVKINKDSHLSAGDFIIYYDMFYFSISDIQIGDSVAANGGMLMFNPNYNTGVVQFTYINENGLVAEEVLLAITFSPNYQNFKFKTEMFIQNRSTVVNSDFEPIIIDYEKNEVSLSDSITYKFVDYNDELIKYEKISKDQTVTYPSVTLRPFTQFDGWQLVSKLNGEIVYKATYRLNQDAVNMNNLTKTYDKIPLNVLPTSSVDGVSFDFEISEMINVGTYTIEIDVFLDGKKQFTLFYDAVIEKKLIDLSVESLSINFGETPNYKYTLEGLIEGDQINLVLSTSESNVGIHEIVASISNNNYMLVYTPSLLTIMKSSYDVSNLSFEDATYTYDGTAKSISLIGELPIDIEVVYQNNEQTDVGVYEVVVEFILDLQNYEPIPNLTALLTIEKATYDISDVLLTYSSIYNGEQQFPEINMILPEGLSITFENLTIVDSGVYVLNIIWLNQNENYHDINPLPIEFTILPSPLLITIHDKESQYLDNLSPLTYDLEGEIYPNDVINIQLSKEEGLIPGYYVITAIAAHKNYDIEVINGQYHITNRVIDLSLYSVPTMIVTYNGQAHKYQLPDILPDGVLDILIEDTEYIYPNTYEVTGKYVLDPFYTTEDLFSATFVIQKAKIANVVFTNLEHVYDGQQKSADIDGLTTPYGDTLFVFYESNSSFVDAGIYNIEALISHPYYIPITIEGTLLIQKGVRNLSDLTFETSSTQITFDSFYIKDLYVSINHSEFSNINLITGLQPKTTYEIQVYLGESRNYHMSESHTLMITTYQNLAVIVDLINSIDSNSIYSKSLIIKLIDESSNLSDEDKNTVRDEIDLIVDNFNELTNSLNMEYRYTSQIQSRVFLQLSLISLSFIAIFIVRRSYK